MKRCSREKWLVKHEQDKADAIARSPHALSANVRKGADVLADVLVTRKGETKLHLSKYALEASQEAAKHPQKLTITRQAKEIAQTASEVWAAEQKPCGGGSASSHSEAGYLCSTLKVGSEKIRAQLRVSWSQHAVCS